MYLKLRWDWLFGWKWSNRCPLSPFMGTYKHHPPVFCPPETERQKLSRWWWCTWLHRFTHQFVPRFVHDSWETFLNTYVCLALAEQYFLFLSASLSWPFLQHWPQTNIIFRFGGPNLLCALESCWWDSKDKLKTFWFNTKLPQQQWYN